MYFFLSFFFVANKLLPGQNNRAKIVVNFDGQSKFYKKKFYFIFSENLPWKTEKISYCYHLKMYKEDISAIKRL